MPPLTAAPPTPWRHPIQIAPFTLLDKPTCAAAGGFLALDWCDSSSGDELARTSYLLHAQLAESLGIETGYRAMKTHSISVQQPTGGLGSNKWVHQLACDRLSQLVGGTASRWLWHLKMSRCWPQTVICCQPCHLHCCQICSPPTHHPPTPFLCHMRSCLVTPKAARCCQPTQVGAPRQRGAGIRDWDREHHGAGPSGENLPCCWATAPTELWGWWCCQDGW